MRCVQRIGKGIAAWRLRSGSNVRQRTASEVTTTASLATSRCLYQAFWRRSENIDLYLSGLQPVSATKRDTLSVP